MPYPPDQISIEKLQKLTDKDWEDLHSRLLLFARKWIGQRSFRVNPDPKDLANAAIEKTLSGCRPWNSIDFTLFVHLCGVVKSEISNLVTSHDNKLTSSLDGGAVNGDEIANDDEPTAEDICIEKDMIGRFLGHLAKDAPHLLEYAKLRLLEGEHQAKACSARLNICVSEVYKLCRQLKQRAADFGRVRARGAEPNGAAQTHSQAADGSAEDHDEESGPAMIAWTRGDDCSHNTIGDEALSASSAFPFRCDGGHTDDKQ
jgi:hypothetical protein